MDQTLRFPATKIQPPHARSPRIARPALDAALRPALGSARLVLLQAAAGFGKTSALAAQLPHLAAGTAVAWVSLDEDDDAQRLYTCLSTALEPCDLPWRTSPEALAAQMASGAGGVSRALAELVNALAGAEAPRGLIVLDDLHRLDARAAPGVQALLDALIERLPARWTLAIATRLTPALALARWRAAGELVVFEQAELSFDAAESAALAASAGAAERAAELHARTAGWPAGLRLCLAALGTRGLAAHRVGALMDRHLFEFLASEVLDDMPPGLHDFLLRTSVLPELTAARAAAVSGDAQAAQWMHEIERRGLFATALDAHERTLVLHDLFRSALQDRLRRLWPQAWVPLLQSAAASEADPLRRVGFLLRAQDWAGAERELAQAASDLFLHGGAGEVQRLVGQFDAAWREDSPTLLRLAGVAAYLHWDWERSAQQLGAAVRAARARGDAHELALAQAWLASALYPLDRNAEAEQLLAELSAQPLPPYPRLLALMADAAQHLRRGQLDQVPRLYAEVMDLLQVHGSLFNWWECVPSANWTTLPGIRPLLQRYVSGAEARIAGQPLPVTVEIRTLRAFMHLWAGEIDAALAEAAQAEADMKWLAVSGEATVVMQLFRLLEGAMHGRAAEVEERLRQLVAREDHTSAARRRLWQHQMAIYGVRVSDLLDAGPEALRDWAALLKENPLHDGRADNARAVTVRARHAAALGRWDGADGAAALFTSLQAKLPQMEVMGQALEVRLRAAHALLRCGRLDEAAAWAAPALARMREGERGQALLCGPAVLRALAQAPWGERLDDVARAELDAVAALASRLRGAMPAVGTPQAPSAPTAAGDDILSQREREVLAFIAAGDSNKHIARALHISPHTVKRHVANILDKLALGSRGQAAAWLRDRHA
jgi:LuxR family maltose regulon positive regulatory protein